MKIIKTLVALLITSAILIGVFVLYMVKFNDENFYGGQLKDFAARYPFIVRTFNLNKPGDAKYIYMDNNYSKVNVNVYYTDDHNSSKNIEIWLDDMIFDTVGKSVVYQKISLENIPVKDSYTDDDLLALSKSVRKNLAEPSLNIFYLSFYEPQPQYLGITLDRSSIFIFQGSFDELKEKGETLDRLERSTIMHEWGHLLGLGHIEQEDCVMSEAVHFYSDRQLYSGEVPIEYCAETLYELQSLQNSVK